MHNDIIEISTPSRSAMLDVTREVEAVGAASGIGDGVVRVYIPHTTAGVTINENADPDVIHDILEHLDRTVPWQQDFFRHCEGNSAAHIKSSMVGCCATVPLVDGRLTLGTWQSVFFCEFDGPRHRKIIVTVSAD